MVRLLLFLALVGLSHQQFDDFFLSDPDRINCLDGSACPANQKCFRVMGSPIGVCVPEESPPDSEPARNCVQSAQCKSSERCYRPAGTPIGVCVPGESRKLLDSWKKCLFDGDCAKDEFCGKPFLAIIGRCIMKVTRKFAGGTCGGCPYYMKCEYGKCVPDFY